MIQLTEITHDLATIIISGLQADAIFTDFAKAFDRVLHPLLTEKLKSFSLSSKIVFWISAHLLNCIQFVSVRTAESEHLDVFSGAPQGSVISPTLFQMYVNYIHHCGETGVQLRFLEMIVYLHPSTQN